MPAQGFGIGAFIDNLIDELGLSRVQLSLAYLIATLMSGLILPWGGRLLDHWGARKMILMTAASLGGVLIFLSQTDRLTAQMNRWLANTSDWGTSFTIILLGFFALRFLGYGMLPLISNTMMGKWFHHYRGWVMAISGTLIAFSFILGPKLINELITILGWREAWIAMGTLLIFGMTVLGWLFFRDNPEECGLVMDGRSFPEDPPSNSDLIIKKQFTRAEAIRTFAFWAFNLTLSFQSLFLPAYNFHIISIGSEFGMGPEAILNLFLPAAGLGVLTSLTIGWLSNHIHMKYVLFVLCIGNGLVAAGVLSLPSITGCAAVIIGLGIANGAFMNLFSLIWPRFFGRQHLGAINGFFFASISIANALGPFLFGLCKQYLGSYRICFVACTLVALILALLSLFADNPQRRLPES